MKESRMITDDLSEIETKELVKALPDYFEPSPDIRRNAYLNWRFDSARKVENQFADMARAYFETSLTLIDFCINDNRDKKANIWIFPILFSIIHGIEVYLKGFNSLYSIYIKLCKGEFPSDSSIQGNHDIRELCRKASSLLQKSGNRELLDELSVVTKFINYLYKEFDWSNTGNKEDINGKMTFARYPVLRSGKTHFYANSSRNVTIDLDTLKQWALRIHNVLDGMNWFIDFQIDQMKEAIIEQALIMQEFEAEMMQYYSDY